MRKIGYTSILVCLLLTAGMGQGNLTNSTGGPIFFHDLVGSASPQNLELSRLNVIVEIVYDDLQFVKTDTGFHAEYEVSASIWEGRDQLDGGIWTEKVNVDTYEMTNSRRHLSVSYQSFDLPPDNYDVKIYLQDLQVEDRHEIEAEIELEDYSDKRIGISDVLFTRAIQVDSAGNLKSLFPEVTNRYKGLGSGSKAYFEIYNPRKLDSAIVRYEIKGDDYESEQSFDTDLTGLRTALYFPLPVDSLSNGEYELSVEVESGRFDDKTERNFWVRYAGLPRTAEDMDTAINQLQYIANQDEWKKFKRAADDEKLQVFLDFWEKRDPSPGTEFNERMSSYYARVEAANRNFGVMRRDGWRTDRGMVMIILGPPDNVIRNDYPSNSKPYQIWQYYSINRQFEFYDDTGFGDYRFVWPVSIYELQRFARQRD